MGMIGIVMMLLSAWWLVALPAIALGIVFLPVTIVVAFAVTFAGTVVPLWATNALAARLVPKTKKRAALEAEEDADRGRPHPIQSRCSRPRLILKADVRRTLTPWPSLPLPSAGRAHPPDLTPTCALSPTRTRQATFLLMRPCSCSRSPFFTGEATYGGVHGGCSPAFQLPGVVLDFRLLFVWPEFVTPKFGEWTQAGPPSSLDPRERVVERALTTTPAAALPKPPPPPDPRAPPPNSLVARDPGRPAHRPVPDPSGDVAPTVRRRVAPAEEHVER